ncbi:hypothetical protein RF11_01817 [Thelohanellus kitauei]|uniref:Uncharacterized protein n=1 Tax=Thelohanellus kitauei TaxID=669202 RepID=A0A0C2JM59_THEKT|nr:hypothetical protein RF11_01817 [Thelohanellus kitauei]
MRLEQENALLAHQLVEIKVQCNDKILDKYEEANRKTKEYDFKLKIYSNLFEIIDKNCPNCAALIKENLSTDDPRLNVGNSIADVDSLESKLHNLEMELAVAKLKIAESEACNENLQFQISEYNQKNKKWFKY